MVAAIRDDYRSAPITDAEKVMIEYVIQLTEDAVKITPEHHARLRDAEFGDQAILQTTLIAAWFNYINRVTDALGVGRYPSQS